MRRYVLPAAGLSIVLAGAPTLAAPAPRPQDAPVAQATPPSARDARSMQDAGRFEEAAEAWAAIVEAEPDNGNAWFNLGYCLHGAGHLDAAIEVHRKAATYDDYAGIALYNLGCAYALQGKPDEAFAALAESAARGFAVSDYAGADSDLASLRDDERMALFTGEVLPLIAEHDHQHDHAHQHHHDHGGHAQPSRMQRMMMMAAQAAEQFGPQANEMMKTFGPQAEQMLGEMFPNAKPMIGQLAPAARELMEKRFGPPPTPEEIAARDAQINRNVGEMQAELDTLVSGFTAMARQMIDVLEAQVRNMLENDPQVQQALREIAGDPRFDQMMQGLRQATGQMTGGGGDPMEQAILQAQSLAQSGDTETAISIYEQLLEYMPDHAGANFGLAYTLHMSGDYERAIPAHKRAATFAGYEGIATYNLACAYALTGNPDAAFEALKAADKAGFDVVRHAAGDSDFASLKDDERFEELMRTLKSGPIL